MAAGVVQDWLAEQPLMMQGTVMTGIRGPDTAFAEGSKPIVRWIRALCLVQGNPENDFAELPETLPSVEEIERELEYFTVHYFSHLVHTLQVVGYKHPDEETAGIALNYYVRLCDFLHMFPESEEEMDARLSGEPGTTGTRRPWRNPELDEEERGAYTDAVHRSLRRRPAPPAHAYHGSTHS